jgi:putative spermidine/putrescine transport system permease protein
MAEAFPSYFSIWQKLGVVAIRTTAGAVLCFLIVPIVVVIPLSFNSQPFFSFSQGMLTFQPEAYSLRWYEDVLSNPNWILAIKNSFIIGFFATILATTLGTIAAVGLASPEMPLRRSMTAVLISPMIVPLIIIAAGMFFFYSRFNLVATYPGVIIAHAALGLPFVMIAVTATLAGFDRSLYYAGVGLGANPGRAFKDVVLPLIRPGVISGALFAFVTSFDEVVLILFLAGPQQRTIPRQMFSGLREQINPSILAVATLLVAVSICLLFTLEFLRRRSERLHGRGQH